MYKPKPKRNSIHRNHESVLKAHLKWENKIKRGKRKISEITKENQMEQKYCLACDEPVIDKIPPCPLQCRTERCKAYKKKKPIDTSVKPIIWVMGGPGSGKQDQCEKMVQIYNLTHLATGELLRQEVAAETDRSKCLNSILQRGGLVPNDIVLSLIKAAMDAASENTSGFIIDGYPRTKSQGADFEKYIGPVACIIYFEASLETLADVLEKRAQAMPPGDRIHYRDMSQMRLQTFAEYNPTVLQVYKRRIRKINAEQDQKTIFSEVQVILDPVMKLARETAERKAKEEAETAAAEAEKNAEIKRNASITKNFPIKKEPAPASPEATTDPKKSGGSSPK